MADLLFELIPDFISSFTCFSISSMNLAGISSVPIVIPATFKSFMNRLFTISATSTAVVVARPLAFKVTSWVSDELKFVIMANT